MDSHRTHSHLLGFCWSHPAVHGTHLVPSQTPRGSDQQPWTCLCIQLLPQPHNPPRSLAHPVHFLPPPDQQPNRTCEPTDRGISLRLCKSPTRRVGQLAPTSRVCIYQQGSGSNILNPVRTHSWSTSTRSVGAVQ